MYMIIGYVLLSSNALGCTAVGKFVFSNLYQRWIELAYIHAFRLSSTYVLVNYRMIRYPQQCLLLPVMLTKAGLI